MAELVYPTSEIRRIEAFEQARLAAGVLMERAGAAVAQFATRIALERPGQILVLAGPGNNGGDALVAARLLRERGHEVRVVLLAAPESYRGDALAAWQQWTASGGEAQLAPEEIDLRCATLVVDGLFGIGWKTGSGTKGTNPGRGLPAPAALWIARINSARLPVLAIDIPSGLDADTGRVSGIAVRATHTITFLGGKPGLHTADGPDHCGRITVETLGVDLPRNAAAGDVNAPDLFANALPPRRRNSHKGQFGNLGVCGGAAGMVGAALLAARMGLHAGAGRVYVHLLDDSAHSFDAAQPELMLRSSLEGLSMQALVAGPGLGSGAAAHGLLRQLSANHAALVLDADALNLITEDPASCDAVIARSSKSAATVLTPHPLEAARLLGTDATTIQSDRIDAAKQLAQRYRCIIVLKGAGTIIADDKGRWAVNTTGNPALATAGTGDVLAGLIGALLAQGIVPWPAVLAGVWLHGAAADRLVADGTGPVGLTAAELIPVIRKVLNETFASAGSG